MDIAKIEAFKNRECKAKDIFKVGFLDKHLARDLVEEFHYLGDKDFMCTIAYGLFDKDTGELLGCATFGVVGGTYALKGWFGITNEQSDFYYELSRLVLKPELNGCNATSYLLGNAIKKIKKYIPHIKAILSLADNSMHNGAIYQACNFKYFGITNYAKDFYNEGFVGVHPKRVKGKLSDMRGVWLPRTRKHRYLYIIDPSVEVLYEEEPYPKGNDMNRKAECCNGSNCVYDKRFGRYYTCPKCVGRVVDITDLVNSKLDKLKKVKNE